MPATMHLVPILAQWMALLPLAYLAVFRWDAPTAYWLVAVAFAMSFVGDVVAVALDGSWAFRSYYVTAQYGFFLLALVTEGAPALIPALAVYCVLGTALYLGMVRYATPEQYEPFMRWWYPYQGARLASFGLFINAARRTA